MRGDPNNCAGGGGCFQSIIGTASPVSIAAQGQAEVSLTWVFDGVQVIYGIIDPMNIITGIAPSFWTNFGCCNLSTFSAEVHETNNVAYGLIYVSTNPDIASIPEVGTGISYLDRNLVLFVDPDPNNVFIPNYQYVS